MKTKLFITLSVLLLALSTAQAAEPSLDGGLEKLRPFLGVWRGEFKRSTPENPMIDIAQWERALNGKAIRILHSINNGMYGGESLLFWDAAQEKIVYSYFTTASFQTVGTMTVKGKKITVHEKIIGNAGGAEEVRASIELREDGTMLTKSEFLKQGAWEAAHEILYRPAAGAKVVFK